MFPADSRVGAWLDPLGGAGVGRIWLKPILLVSGPFWGKSSWSQCQRYGFNKSLEKFWVSKSTETQTFNARPLFRHQAAGSSNDKAFSKFIVHRGESKVQIAKSLVHLSQIVSGFFWYGHKLKEAGWGMLGWTIWWLGSYPSQKVRRCWHLPSLVSWQSKLRLCCVKYTLRCFKSVEISYC